jgi:hypothetical protein
MKHVLTRLIRQAANQKDKYHKICLKKQNIPVRELCKGLPPEFGTLLCYCRNLKSEPPHPSHRSSSVAESTPWGDAGRNGTALLQETSAVPLTRALQVR